MKLFFPVFAFLFCFSAAHADPRGGSADHGDTDAPVKRYALGVNWAFNPTGMTPEQYIQAGKETARRADVIAQTLAKLQIQAIKETAAGRSSTANKFGTPEGVQEADIKRLAKAAGVPTDTADYSLQNLVGASRVSASYNTGITPNSDGFGYPYVTSVKDQGGCGSCTAFAVTAAAENAVAYAYGWNNPSGLRFNQSEQWLYFQNCNQNTLQPSANYAPTCSSGWWPSEAAAVLTKLGQPSEDNYKYNGVDYAPGEKCTIGLKPLNTTFLRGSYALDLSYSTASSSTNLIAAKRALTQGKTFVTTFAVYNDFFYYTGRSRGSTAFDAIYRPRTNALAGYHAVQVVGYSDRPAYWIAKNSWGTGWGFNGYFKIAMGTCGFMASTQGSIVGFNFNIQLPSSASWACGDCTCDAKENTTNCAKDCDASKKSALCNI